MTEPSSIAILTSLNPQTAPTHQILSTCTLVTIGRSSACTIRCKDQRCSLIHCEISIDISSTPSFTLIDKSRNGTYINNSIVRTKQIGRNNSTTLLSEDEILILTKQGVDEVSFIGFTFSILPNKRTEQVLLATGKTHKLDSNDIGNFTCLICCQILHQPVILSPCLHLFCGGCFSSWSNKSLACPTCKITVSLVKPDYSLTQKLEDYSTIHPETKRTQEDIENNEKRNKFYYEAKGIRPVLGKCRQCKEIIDDFQCIKNQLHQMCCKCRELVPVRPQATQECFICKRYFCNLYWESKPKCLTGIAPVVFYVNSHFIGVTPSSLNENRFEQTILNAFIRKRRLQFEEIGLEILRKIEKEEWMLEIESRGALYLKKDSNICTECAILVWDDFLAKYRKRIENYLPEHIRNRVSCSSGPECITQKYSLAHASQFNHI